jgi:hypothetical protein
MPLSIPYESDGFPAGGPVANTSASLTVSWSKLLWAALTVGRPSRQYVFRHGGSSVFEALFRLSLVRMALEQSGPQARRLRRTAAAKSLDPTEKGAINYFLGMTVAKLFAAELLATPWLLHLDVFRPQLNAVLSGRSRPDLVGKTTSGQWIALECKGRVSPPNEDVKAKAKGQAQRVVSIGGSVPSFTIGAVTYFRNDILQFFWRDPAPETQLKNPIGIEFTAAMWDHYYEPVRAIVATSERSEEDEIVWATVHGSDVEVGVHKRVWSTLQAGGAEAQRVAERFHGEFGVCNVDGVAVRAGESWTKLFDDLVSEDGR